MVTFGRLVVYFARRLRTPFWSLLAAFYLVGVFCENIGWGRAERFFDDVLPRPLHFFLQIAALFPKEATAITDYRAQAWVCGKGWQEIDTRPYFPIDREEKENRFQRTMHFYYTLEPNREAMQALEEFVMQRHNTEWNDDGIPKSVPIAGVRFLSIRLPIPKPGQHAERYHRPPLDEVPERFRHYMYWTPKSKRSERCEGEEISE